MRRIGIVAGWWVALACLPAASGAWADGFFQSVSGEVSAAQGEGEPTAAAKAQRFPAGTTITTGANSRAVLRLDDGQGLVLYENTEFRLAEFRFDVERPELDAMRLELKKGALRSVSGLMAQRSRERVSLALPQASVALEGTDFMVMLLGPAYLSVLNGAVALGNAAGSASFAAPSLAVVANALGLAAPLAAADLPPPAAAAFAALRGVALGPGIEPGLGGPSSAALGVGPNLSLAGSMTGLLIGVAAVAAASAQFASTGNH